MSGRGNFYLTTAIPYINGPPHHGHAYEAIASDVLARFKRLDGYDVMFLTGTDEHGQKVARQAEAEGKEPGVHADEIAQTFRDMVGVTGLVITKLDGSAKGGVVVALAERVALPVHAVGVGESLDDLRPFDPRAFARNLMGLED